MTVFHLRKKIAISFALIFCAWMAGFVCFVQKIPNSQQNFPENSADAIVVLTGDSGRVEYGLQLLAEKKAGKLFISGVGEKVSISDILRHAPEEIRSKISRFQITLGQYAENTIGNAEETDNFLKKQEHHKILLVTSDYHLPRAMFEFANNSPNYEIIPAPFIGDKWWNSSEICWLIFSEYHKYMVAHFRHWFISATDEKPTTEKK